MKKFKNDIILVVVLLLISVIGLLMFNIFSEKEDLKAMIYVDENLVETIDLSKLGEEVTSYKIQGANGEVTIEAKYNAIRIVHANCPSSYCENLGFSDSTIKPIICVPNKVYIKLVSNSNKVDIEL